MHIRLINCNDFRVARFEFYFPGAFALEQYHVEIGTLSESLNYFMLFWESGNIHKPTLKFELMEAMALTAPIEICKH